MQQRFAPPLDGPFAGPPRIHIGALEGTSDPTNRPSTPPLSVPSVQPAREGRTTAKEARSALSALHFRHRRLHRFGLASRG